MYMYITAVAISSHNFLSKEQAMPITVTIIKETRFPVESCRYCTTNIISAGPAREAVCDDESKIMSRCAIVVFEIFCLRVRTWRPNSQLSADKSKSMNRQRPISTFANQGIHQRPSGRQLLTTLNHNK